MNRRESSMRAPSLRIASSKDSGAAMALNAPTVAPCSASSGSHLPVNTSWRCRGRWVHSMISAVRLYRRMRAMSAVLSASSLLVMQM